MIVIGAFSVISFYFATSFWMWFPLRAILHIALTVLFILSEFWISTSAPPNKRGFVLGIYATVLSLGFAGGTVAVRADRQPGLPALRRHLRAGHHCRRPGAGGLARKPDDPPPRHGIAGLHALHLAGADGDGRGPGVRRRRDGRLRAVSGLWRAHRLFGGRRRSAAQHDRSRQRAAADPARHAQRPHQRPTPPAAGLRRRRPARHAADASPRTSTGI